MHTFTTALITTFALLSLLGTAGVQTLQAATMAVSPSTGVHTVNDTFSVVIRLDSAGEPVNAAEGALRYDPDVLSVVSASRANSIFNLWVTEPTVDRASGEVTWSGGLPSGYTGAGEIMRVTFRAKSAGTARLQLTDGAVLANDGRGSNVLTNMNGGSVTVQPRQSSPEPEVIEYVPAATAAPRPDITSTSHPDPGAWHATTTARLAWSLPTGVTGVRTLLNEQPNTVPTKVYESPIDRITIPDLSEGVSYFHLQFRNSDGWGQVAHYRLAVDTSAPAPFTPRLAAENDASQPRQIIALTATDAPAGVVAYEIDIPGHETIRHEPATATSTYTLPTLDPGQHTVTLTAIDAAGNRRTADLRFTITAFEKPAFTEYPDRVTAGVVPVIRGVTRPSSTVTVFVQRIGSEPVSYETIAGPDGEFAFIPERPFDRGVYELSAAATDPSGATSEVSHPIRILVEPPGVVRIGGYLVDVLSVIVPLFALCALLIVGSLYLFAYLRRFRRRVRIESTEAHEMLTREFAALHKTLRAQEAELVASRKTGKLTKAEEDMVATMDRALQESQRRVEKEVADIEDLSRARGSATSQTDADDATTET